MFARCFRYLVCSRKSPGNQLNPLRQPATNNIWFSWKFSRAYASFYALRAQEPLGLEDAIDGIAVLDKGALKGAFSQQNSPKELVCVYILSVCVCVHICSSHTTVRGGCISLLRTYFVRSEHVHVPHLAVILERLVRRARKVKIEPSQPAVIASHDKVIPRGVHVHATNPLAPADQAFHSLLQRCGSDEDDETEATTATSEDVSVQLQPKQISAYYFFFKRLK